MKKDCLILHKNEKPALNYWNFGNTAHSRLQSKLSKPKQSKFPTAKQSLCWRWLRSRPSSPIGRFRIRFALINKGKTGKIIMKKTISILTALMLSLSIVSALEEPKVILTGATPDQPFLYFFKVNIKEPITLFFLTGQADIQKRLEYLETRTLELKKVSLKITDTEKLKKLQEKIEKENKADLDEIEERSNDLDEQKIKELDVILEKHIIRLNEVLEKVPEQAKSGIENAINSSSKVLDTIKEREIEDLKDTVDTGILSESREKEFNDEIKKLEDEREKLGFKKLEEERNNDFSTAKKIESGLVNGG